MTSRATSASVRPTSRPAAIEAMTRSAAWAASRMSSTSAGSLRIRSERSTADASENLAPGSTRWSPSTNAARRPSDTATAPRLWAGRWSACSRVSATSAIGSSVSSQPTTVTSPARGGRAGAGGRRLEPRGDQRHRRAVGDRQHEHGQPLERHRVVAGEIAEVGADADQQRVEARGGRFAARAGEPLAVALGGDRGDGGVRAAHATCSGVGAGPGIGASVSVGAVGSVGSAGSAASASSGQRADPGGEHAVAVLEQGAIGVDAGRPGVGRPPARIGVVVLPDGDHRDGGFGRGAHGIDPVVGDGP